jgi:hypothetical protein
LKMDAPIKKVIIAMVLLAGTGLLFGCGGGSSGGDSPNNTNPTTPAQVDLTGTWQVEQVITGNCSGDTYPITEIHIFTGTQQGNSLTFHDAADGTDYTGTISGYTITLKGTVPDGIGTMIINSTCTCAADGESLTGSGTWTYQEPGYSCNGSAQVTGTKLTNTQTQVDATGTWTGSFSSNNHSGISGTFSATITDTNGQLAGTISVPLIAMTDAELVGTVNGSTITFGDIDHFITFTGVVSSTGTAAGSYDYDTWGDEGTWNANR